MCKLLTILPAEKADVPKKKSGMKITNKLGLEYDYSDDSDDYLNLL